MSVSKAVPRHVGIIMDGNRRWAVDRGLRPMKGHEEGALVTRTIARHAFEAGVEFITVFAFSTENWKRPNIEVDFLMKLALKFFKSDLDDFVKDGYRIAILGSRDKVSKSILHAIDETEKRTKDNQKGTLGICFNYSSNQELNDAAKALVNDVEAGSSQKEIKNYLYHPEIPELDLIIRTSGEQRLSGFMLPRANYAELKFVDIHWPAFTVQNFQTILDDFADRHRRFGS